MIQPRVLTAAGAALLSACASAPATPPAPSFIVEGNASAADAAAARAMAEAGRARIENFFGRSFATTPRLIVAGDRAGFDAAFPAEWGMTPTQCWMVGVGVADFFALLAPSAWDAEACDHDNADTAEAQALVIHELTHVYHGQYNPTGDFTGMDDIGWFVEGLAVLVSGQLEMRHADAAASAIAAGAAPTALASAWSGQYRYGVCGSMVQYIDERWGRETLTALLPATTQQQVLDTLGVSEAQFLADWRAWASR
ncbi:MAG: hypothetical protein R3C16_04585 [Hyphomonadaceae bacterium]